MTEKSPSGSAKVILIVCLLAGLVLALVAGAGTFIYLNRDKLGLVKKEKPAEAPAHSEQTAPPVSPPPGPSPGLIPVRQLDALAGAMASRPIAASAPIHANARTYRSYTAREDVLVLVDYYADWCGPCRGIAPSLSKLAATHGDKVVVLKVNIDRERALATDAGVRSIPDVRLLFKGKELARSIGGRPYSHYEGLILQHAKRLSPPKPAPRPAATPKPTPAQPARPTQPTPSITPLDKDWLPPGVSPVRS